VRRLLLISLSVILSEWGWDSANFATENKPHLAITDRWGYPLLLSLFIPISQIPMRSPAGA